MPTCIVPGQSYEYGDVNGDGIISVTDVVLMGNHIGGGAQLTGAAFTRADLNGDGVVDQADMDLLQAYMANPAGVTFPVCGGSSDVVDDTQVFQVTMASQPAKGEIASINAPASALPNSYITVSTVIRNTGGSVGNFKIRVGTVQSTAMSVAQGSTNTFAVQVQMPSSGTVATFTLECIRIT